MLPNDFSPAPQVRRLEVLSRRECWTLLSHKCLGRVAFTERALPAIRPVNYALVGTHLLLRTGMSGLARHLAGQVVAFEVDELDGEPATGWSVVVTGTARVLRTPGELARYDSVPVVPLAGAVPSAAVVIAPGLVTGRRITTDPEGLQA